MLKFWSFLNILLPLLRTSTPFSAWLFLLCIIYWWRCIWELYLYFNIRCRYLPLLYKYLLCNNQTTDLHLLNTNLLCFVLFVVLVAIFLVAAILGICTATGYYSSILAELSFHLQVILVLLVVGYTIYDSVLHLQLTIESLPFFYELASSRHSL